MILPTQFSPSYGAESLIESSVRMGRQLQLIFHKLDALSIRQIFPALDWTSHIDFKLISGHIFSWSTGDPLARSGSGS
jgi:hypothetical protein